MGLYRVNISRAHSLGVNLRPVWHLGPKTKYSDNSLLTMSRDCKKKVLCESISDSCGLRFLHILRGQCPHLLQKEAMNKFGPCVLSEKNYLLIQKNCNKLPVRFQVSSSSKKDKETASKSITETKGRPSAELTVGQKVKQAGKDATYTGIVILGLGVTGIMFYAIGRELFSGQSPSGVYGRAFKLCKKNEELVISLGEPIKGYGEMTRRGRRRHVSHQEYDVGGVRHIRMKFYVEGPSNKGTVHLDAQQNAKGKYEFRYIFVELENYPRKTIVIEDNR